MLGRSGSRRGFSPAQAAVNPDTTVEDMGLAAHAAATGDWDAAPAIWARHGHAGNGRAPVEIGRCFDRGWRVARDIDLALQWLTAAADGGHPLGQPLLGDFFFNGEDGTLNRSIAEEWYARAARQRDAHAQDMLSWMLVAADHGQADHREATHRALKAAEQDVAASRESCTPEERLEAERRASLPLQGEEAAP